MKKIFIGFIFAIFILFTTNAFCEPEVKEKDEGGACPITQVKGGLYDCLKCHVAKTFQIKEVMPFEEFEMPNISSNFITENNETVGIYDITGTVGMTDSRNLNSFFLYLNANHKYINKVIIELHSPGGSLFEGYKIVGIMKHWQSRGYHVETRVYGFAASAAFFIFCGGDTRMVSPQAELMWHELITFSMFDIAGPADKEDEAAVLRHLQDTANTMIADISNLTKDELDHKIRKKEFWVNGSEALEYGFATGMMK